MAKFGCIFHHFSQKTPNLSKIGCFPDPTFFYFYFWIGSVAEGNTTFFFSWPNLNSVVPCVQQNETYHSTMHTLFRHTQVSHYDRVCIKADLDLYLIILRGYCTPGPYIWRLCVFSWKIKQLWTKYPMDLVRNVQRKSKITNLLQ